MGAHRLHLHLVDSDPAVASALETHFAPFPEVRVVCADLLTVALGVVVSPANGYGFMDGGIDARYAAFFGPALVRAVRDACLARPEGYLPVGAAVAVPTGHASVHHVIVAPTMLMPEHVPATNAYRSLRAALRVMAGDPALGEVLYCPGLGTLVGGVEPTDAAREMVSAFRDWASQA